MQLDNISIIISVIVLLISIVSNVISLIQMKKSYRKNRIDDSYISYKLKNQIRNISFLDKSNEGDANVIRDDIIDCMKITSDVIKNFYSKTTCTISIKLISKVDSENPLNSQLVTWAVYPNNEFNNKVIYTIKNNTEFSSIVKNKNTYFFVTDLKKFSTLNTYINENKDFLNLYNTLIVFPIQKKEKDVYYLLGFLCIDSPGEYKDIRKNKEMLNVIKVISSAIYDRFSILSLKKEMLTVKIEKDCLKL